MGVALLLTGAGFIVLAGGLIGPAGMRRRVDNRFYAPSSNPSSSA